MLLHFLLLSLVLWLAWRLVVQAVTATLFAIGWLVTRPVWLARTILRAFETDARRLRLVL